MGHFPQNSQSGNSIIGFPFLSTARLYPLLSLTHGLPLLYWLGISGWCLNLVRAPLPCVSKACLPFMHFLQPRGLSSLRCPFCHSFLTFYGVDELLGLRSLYLAFSLGQVLLGMGLSFFNPALVFFVGRLTPLPYRPVVSAMLSFKLCLLGLFQAYCTHSFCLVPVAQYYYWSCTDTILGFLSPFHPFVVSLAYFIPLGILGPFHFLEHPQPIPIPHSHGLLLSLLGFSGLNYHILYFWGLQAFPPTPFTQFLPLSSFGPFLLAFHFS